MTLINKIFWLAIVFECVFIFLLKEEKRKKYSSVRKSYSTSRKSIGGRKKKEKFSNTILFTTTLTYFDNLKIKQQDQGGKNRCYTESFTSLTISNFRTTVVCFEYTKLLK